MMGKRIAGLAAAALLMPLALASCGASDGASRLASARSAHADVAQAPNKRTGSMFPGCAAGGSVDLVGGSRGASGTTVAAAAGTASTLSFQVADDNGGHVRSATVFVREPGTTLRTPAPHSLATMRLTLAGESSGRSTLAFTPPVAGRYPIVVHSVQSVSDACAKRALAAGAADTDVVQDSVIGWVDAS